MTERLQIAAAAAVLGAVVGVGVGVASGAQAGDERRAIVPQDQAKARSIVLRLTDMDTGWKALGRTKAGPSVSCPPRFVPDFSSFTVTGDQDGKQFYIQTSDTDVVVASSVEVFRTASDTNAEWRIWTSAAAVSCLSEKLEEAAPVTGVALTVQAKASPLNLPRVAPRQFARRYLVIWLSDSEMRTITFDDIYLVRDRAAVSLVIQRVGPPGKPDPKLERRLLRTLGERLAGAFA